MITRHIDIFAVAVMLAAASVYLSAQEAVLHAFLPLGQVRYLRNWRPMPNIKMPTPPEPPPVPQLPRISFE